jgi:hypothetical protein
MTCKSTLLAFALVAYLPHSAIAESLLPSDGIISSPGTYRLSADVTSNGYAAITIKSDDVHLDLDGKSITCPVISGVAQKTHGIHVRRSDNVSVRNGKIIGCVIGIGIPESNNVTIDGVHFISPRYVAVNGTNTITGLTVRNSTIVAVSGYHSQAYAIGVNRPGSNCLIERNEFRDIYRQAHADPAIVGEGVAILLSPNSSGCIIRSNVMENAEVRSNLTIGVWSGTASASVIGNRIINFGRGIAANSATLYVHDNFFWMSAEQWGSYAIGAQHGLVTRNIVLDYDVGVQGEIPASDNLILPDVNVYKQIEADDAP